MICAPRLLKCGKPFADYEFTTFQQPLLLLRRQRKPLCLSPYFRRLVVLTKGSTLLLLVLELWFLSTTTLLQKPIYFTFDSPLFWRRYCVIVRNESTSERAIFRLLIASAEGRPVVFDAYFCDSKDWNCGYSQASGPMRIWY